MTGKLSLSMGTVAPSCGLSLPSRLAVMSMFAPGACAASVSILEYKKTHGPTISLTNTHLHARLVEPYELRLPSHDLYLGFSLFILLCFVYAFVLVVLSS